MLVGLLHTSCPQKHVFYAKGGDVPNMNHACIFQ